MHRLDPKTHKLIYERADADGPRTWEPECPEGSEGSEGSAAVRGMLIAAVAGIAGGALYAAINTRMKARSRATATNGHSSREKA